MSQPSKGSQEISLRSTHPHEAAASDKTQMRQHGRHPGGQERLQPGPDLQMITHLWGKKDVFFTHSVS